MIGAQGKGYATGIMELIYTINTYNPNQLQMSDYYYMSVI